MALHEAGHEIGSKLPPELRHFRARDIEWLESYLRRYKAPLIDEGTYLFSVVREMNISSAISADPHSPCSVPSILAAHRDALVPSSYLDWLRPDDGRLMLWMLTRVFSDLVNPLPGTPWTNRYSLTGLWDPRPRVRGFHEISAIERKSEIVRAIDFWGVPMAMKQEWINEQRSNWGMLIRHDKRYVKWLRNLDRKTGKENLDKEQLEWAFDYLNSHGRRLLVPPATSVEETYAIVTALIDGLSYPHPHNAEKTVFIDTMKKAWSQKKYRDAGKAKKPYHLPLTVDVKKQLDWVAETSGHRATDILAALIKDEFERVKGGRRCIIDEKSGI